MSSQTETIRYDIAVLLATRGRTDALKRSVDSLLDLAADPTRVQVLFAFDRDDDKGLDFFTNTYQHELQARKANFVAMGFDRVGYGNLQHYYNSLVPHAPANWLMIWNDDAVMQTQGWDQEIMKWQGQFKLLSVHTHRDHPYSIFPILPRSWYECVGYISPHPSQDAWVSQQAYMLDIYQRIPVHVLHDRFDLTGNNADDTYRQRHIREGRPTEPGDFHHVDQQQLRMADTDRLSKLMQQKYQQDTSWWQSVLTGVQDPWVRLKENDVNGQMVQFRNPQAHFDSLPSAQPGV